MRQVTIALLSGPMYDPLYGLLDGFAGESGCEVEIAFRGDHPALNAHLASLKNVPYDIVCTHTKYAPSQARFLAPLDELLKDEELDDFAPLTLALARVGQLLLGLPRNIDVRLLHYRTDLIPRPPETWDALLNVARGIAEENGVAGFVFPGKESGLFGTFYELAEMGGAHLFPADGIPDIQNTGGKWALELLRTFYQDGVAPRQLLDWHYDEVHRCFREGRAAMVGDWPGYYALYRDPKESKVADRFAVCPYPIGPSQRSLAYGGSHTFALTRKGAENAAAIDMLRFLTSPQCQLLEARRGSVPVRRSVMRTIQAESDPQDLARWQALQAVIDGQVVIPPKMGCYPEIEEAIWKTVQAAILGASSVTVALHSITLQIRQIVERNHG